MADLTVRYKGNPIVELSESGTKTLKTAGKYCEGDISVEYAKPTGGGGGSGSTIELDTTLSVAGKAADAKAVGDALAEKQDKLIAGDNITIAADGKTISVTGGSGNWKQAGFVQSETDGETLEVTGLDTKSVRLLVCAAAYANDSHSKGATIKINGTIRLNYSGFIELTTAKITVIEIHLITTASGNYIFAPNFPTMRVNDTTATSTSYQVGNYSAWFLTRADTVEKIESISFVCSNGTLLTGSKLNVEVI